MQKWGKKMILKVRPFGVPDRFAQGCMKQFETIVCNSCSRFIKGPDFPTHAFGFFQPEGPPRTKRGKRTNV